MTLQASPKEPLGWNQQFRRHRNPRRPETPWVLYFMPQRTWSPAKLQQTQWHAWLETATPASIGRCWWAIGKHQDAIREMIRWWDVILGWLNEGLLYYPAISYLDKWTLGDSAPHFMCKCRIKQNSNTFVLEVLTLLSGELWITAAFLSFAEEMVKTRVGSEPSTPSTQLGFTNLMYTCVLLLRRWALGCIYTG